VRLRRIALLLAVLAATPFLSGCVITPQFLACLASGELTSDQCQSDSVAPGPPSAPTGLTATPGAGASVTLDWHANEEPDLDHYYVRWSTTPGGPYTTVGYPQSSVYTDSCPSTEVHCHLYTCRIYYVVQAVDKDSQVSPPSNEASARLYCNPPAAPEELTASAANGYVSLQWDAVSGATAYRVYRSDNADGPFTRLVQQVAATFTDYDVQNGTTYFYRVTAVDVAGNESGPSDVVSATPTGIIIGDVEPPAAPTGLTATAGDGRVQLDWNDNSEPDLDHYLVLESTEPDAFHGLSYVTVASDYLDTAVSNGMTYYFKVRAIDHAGNRSDYSAIVPATPEAAEPAAPTGLTATGGYVSVQLDWNDNGEADLAGYNVYRSSDPAGPFGLLAQPTASEQVDFDTPVDQPLYYYVTALDTAGHESAPSETVSATACGSPGCVPARTLRAASVGFKLTVHSRYSGGGSVALVGDRIIGSGLGFSGPFTLMGPRRTVSGTWHSRVDWQLSPTTRTGSGTGIGLATFASGQACLRFRETYSARPHGRTAIRGTFVSLGATGDAARLLGSGKYRIKPARDGSLVYRGTSTPSAAGPLPAECLALGS
jgi:fibronectin type 3 domain-containing protein